jgi:hypothetical protein
MPTGTARDPRFVLVLDEFETRRMARDMAVVQARLFEEGITGEELQERLASEYRAWCEEWPGAVR